MFIFIFPKAFEVFKFLSYFRDVHNLIEICPVSNDFDSFFRVKVGRENEIYHFVILLIGESDINFRKLFVSSWDKIYNGLDKKDGIKLVLIGSCGSPNTEDFGKLFLIKNAIKHDRGEIREDRLFSTKGRNSKKLNATYRIGKLEEAIIDWYSSIDPIRKRNINTTNFLNHSTIDNDKSCKDNLLDMETWDFYDICEQMYLNKQIDSFFSIRFVTDIAANPDKTYIERDALVELMKNQKGSLSISEVNDTIYTFLSKNDVFNNKWSEDSDYYKHINNLFQENDILVNRDSHKIKLLVGLTFKFKFDFIFSLVKPCLETCERITDFGTCVWYNHFSKEYQMFVEALVKRLKDDNINVSLNKSISDSWVYNKTQIMSLKESEQKLITNYNILAKVYGETIDQKEDHHHNLLLKLKMEQTLSKQNNQQHHSLARNTK